MYNKKLLLIFSLVTIMFLFTGCQATDLVAKVSVTSFDSLVKAVPDQVVIDNINKGWEIRGVDGEESLLLSYDFNSDKPDITVKFDAKPFLQAGLDVSKLPKGQYLYDKTTGLITMPFEYGGDSFSENAKKTVLNTFKEIVKTNRDIIGYHEEGDHYKISLGNGNSFAWAKDMDKNKTDMAFILNPEPFIAAGVDMSSIKDWVFTKMPMTDKDGKPIKVDVLIKGFDVK